MDNKLVIQLLQSKAEEIKSLLEHFSKNTNDLNSGLELLETRILGLSKDFEILKKNLSTSQPQENIHAELFRETFLNEDSFSKDEEIIETIPEQSELNDNSALEFKHSTPTEPTILNERLHSDPTKMVAQKVSTTKIEDIQSAIGLNDRFLFIRELFENKTEEYNSAVSFINQSSDFKSVMEWAMSHKNWDMEDPTVVQFIEITKRKF